MTLHENMAPWSRERKDKYCMSLIPRAQQICHLVKVQKVLFGAFVVAISGITSGAPDGYELIWRDEFEGNALNSDNWTIGRQRRDDAIQTAEAVSVSDGVMRIRTYTTAEVHYTGFLTTARRLRHPYGFFEARISFHGAPGEWCAFWLQSPSYGREVGNPSRSGVEVDIAEHRVTDRLGRNVSDLIAFNVHWDGYGKDHKQAGSFLRLNEALNGTWHIYGVLWTPEGFRFFVDGLQQWQSTVVVSDVSEDVRLTCEVRDNSWAGSIPKNGYGSRDLSSVGMDVDWVRVWQKP